MVCFRRSRNLHSLSGRSHQVPKQIDPSIAKRRQRTRISRRLLRQYMDWQFCRRPTKVDLERGYIRSYKNLAGRDTGLSNNSIYKLYVHNPDTMFIGTSQGVNIYHFQTDSFTPFLPDVFRLIRIDDIIRDKRIISGFLHTSTASSGIIFLPIASTGTRKERQVVKL